MSVADRGVSILAVFEYSNLAVPPESFSSI
jgi:hypothetical protein